MIFFVIFSPGPDLHPANMYDPSLSWKSIKTEHFWIHYHQGLEETAHRMVQISERVHKKLSREIRWVPSLRTDIVLVDNTDMANGFSTPFPFNKIQIYTVRPMINSVLNNYDDWLEMVFTHEYTHILDMDMVSWLPAGTRVIPGRVCFPNAMLPVWTLEGSAVYHESKHTIYGRNNSTYTDMVIRTEVRAGSFKPIDEASHFPRTWPRGNVPYLYGGLFIDYLEKAYGSESIEKFFHENSDNIVPYSDNIYPIPYFYNKDAKDVYRKSFPVLWNEWEEFIKNKYRRQIEEIRTRGVTEYTMVSGADYDSTIPRFSRDGRTIYYIKGSPYDDNALTRFDMEDNREYRLCRVNDPNYLSLSPLGQIYLADAEFFDTFSLYYDVHVFDKGYRRATWGLRGGYIDIFPDGNRLLVIRGDRLKYTLAVTDLSFRTIQTLVDRTGVQLGSPRISPGGDDIVFTIKDQAGFTDLVLCNIKSMDFRRLTNDRFNDIDPAWHPDGKRIIFSSDRDGVYNLYEYRLDDRSLSKLSSVMGGAFSPDVSGDGKLIVFSSYESRGNRISLMNYPETAPPVQRMEPAVLKPDFFRDNAPLAGTGESSRGYFPEPYNPIYSLMPAIRLPYIYTQEIYPGKKEWVPGFIIMGGDTFLHHVYSLDAAALTSQKRASVTATYTYAGLYPDITIGYKDDSLFYGKDEFPWTGSNKNELQRELRRFGFASLFFPFMNYSFQQYIQVSYIYEKIMKDNYVPGYEVLKYEATFPRVQGIYIFTNSKSYIYSISPENGRSVVLLADYYNKKIGSDERTLKARGEYSEFLPGPGRNNVLMARLRGGYSKNNQVYLSQYNLGRFKNNASDDPLEKSDWGVRGYPSGSQYGDNMAMGSLEYRFPLFQRDAGIKTVPLMFRDLWISLFCESGNVWNRNPDMKDPVSRRDFMKEFKSSAGGEIYMKFTLGYQIDITTFMGYARGFNKPGETQYYWGLATSLDTLLQTVRKRITYL